MANLTFKIKMKTSGSDVVAGDLVNNEIVFGANPGDKNIYVKDNTAELHTFMPVDDAVTSTKKSWSSSKIAGMTLPTGTAADNTLRWNGSAWVETSTLVNTGTDTSVKGALNVRNATSTYTYLQLSSQATLSAIWARSTSTTAYMDLEGSSDTTSNAVNIRMFRQTNNNRNVSLNIYAGNNVGNSYCLISPYTNKITVSDCTNGVNVFILNAADRRLEMLNTNNGLYLTPLAPASDTTVLYLAGVTDTPTIKYNPTTTEYTFSKAVSTPSYVKAGSDFTSVANVYNGGGSFIAPSGGNLSTALGTNQLTWSTTNIDATTNFNIRTFKQLAFIPATADASGGTVYFDCTRGTDRSGGDYLNTVKHTLKLNFPAADNTAGFMVGVTGQATNYVQISPGGQIRATGRIYSASSLSSGTQISAGSYLASATYASIGSYATVGSYLRMNQQIYYRDDYFNVPINRDGSNNCKAYWVFDTTTPVDISGNGADTTVMTGLSVPTLLRDNWSAGGRFNSAIICDASTKGLVASIPTGVIDGSRSFTLTAWVKSANHATSGGGCILGYYNSATSGAMLRVYSDRYRATVWDASSGKDSCSATTVTNLGTTEYVHLTMVRNYTAPAVQIYVNGFLHHQITTASGTLGTATEINLGNESSGATTFYLTGGYIAEAAVFDYAMDAITARSLFMKGLQTKPIILTAAGGYPATTTPCGGPTQNEDTTNDIDYWTLDYDHSTNEAAFWTFPLPDDYQPGTPLKAQVNWTGDTGTSAQKVRWLLKARNLTDNTVLDGTWGSDTTIEDTWLGNKYLHKSPIRILNSSTYPKAGETMVVKVARDASITGDMTCDAKLLSIKLEYTPMR